MYTLLKQVTVREELLKRGVRIFTPEVFSRIFQTPDYKTKYFLEKQVKEGLFLRLKQGLYTLKTDQPSEEEIANALYKPSYLSFEYALGYYNILPEMPYAVTSATTKATRLFTLGDKAFSYRSIQENAYTGYHLVKKEDRSVLIAEPEKALVDYFYFVMLNKLQKNDRLIIRVAKSGNYRTGDLNKIKIFEYVDLYEYHKKRLIALLKEVI